MDNWLFIQVMGVSMRLSPGFVLLFFGFSKLLGTEMILNLAIAPCIGSAESSFSTNS